ncbi:MAG TPA: hypothetical protein DCX26_04055 [Pseudomonas sp.]|uniref:DUF6088 family protein n=1 Tax=Stutzerimonas frequens TaxID=2968969 RepID=UPI0007B8CD78|nr:DUF6088 family protein [Stutzerimonas frequens]KZX64219.1 hypothetical protein A3710_15915 [Stutzerimonas frequens]MAL92821.1 hypothetical protein [Pseudomonas sp.]QFU10487.1 hypothetical protein FIU84_00540 [Stutzerimonas frequens]HAW61486.1 hypothetical protein [Pseudomonas sp.]
MPSIPQAIVERCRSLAEGVVLAPKEFLHLGSRSAVDQAFSRLARTGHLIRIGRGLYVSPVQTNNQTRAPSIERIAESLTTQGKQRVAVSGAQAAKSLGLTQSAPRESVFLTTGRSRQLQIGDATVALQHAPYWMLSLGSSRAGDAIRALAWMGQEHVDAATSALYQRLPKDDWGTLASVRASLPSWMAASIGKAATRNEMGRSNAGS